MVSGTIFRRERAGMDSNKLDRIVADARRAALERGQSYRERALKIYPWICGRCAREFPRANLRELTVHHRDHNHDNNPPDGSNCYACTATTTNTSGNWKRVAGEAEHT